MQFDTKNDQFRQIKSKYAISGQNRIRKSRKKAAGVTTAMKKLRRIPAMIYSLKKHALKLGKSEKIHQENPRRKLEEKYYKDLEKLHESYDIYLHDMKHTMRTIAALSEEGNCEEISRIIEKMGAALGSINENIICSNKILNALFTERKGYAADKGVSLELEISEPVYLEDIDELDLITLMGNLLDNAIEAEAYSDKQEGILCNMHMASSARHIIIQVENNYIEKRRKTIPQKSIDSLQMKMKSIGAKHGIGLKSVNRIIKKYGGILETNQSEGRYNVKVILPVQVEWKEESSYMEPIQNNHVEAYSK